LPDKQCECGANDVRDGHCATGWPAQGDEEYRDGRDGQEGEECEYAVAHWSEDTLIVGPFARQDGR
jgi:hypothetical protein